MKRILRFVLSLSAVLGCTFHLPLTHAGPIVRSGVTTGGAGDSAFNAMIAQFRTDLGVLNPPGACAPTPCVGGRREINWDAVPSSASAPNLFPGDFFDGAAGTPSGRQRGARFSTPGTGFMVSENDFTEVATFDSAGEFAAFSPTKLFATLGSAITDVTFSVPGNPGEVADVIGFGAVFTDVDITGLTSIEYFNAQGGSLGSFTVPGVFPVGTGENSQASFSFLGVSFSGGDRVSRVRITSGSHGVDGVYVGVEDAVVMDDFIYGEPVARRAVSEPATLLLLGACALGWCARRKTPSM